MTKWMSLAPDGRADYVLAPLALNIGPLSQHLLLEIACGLQGGSPSLTDLTDALGHEFDPGKAGDKWPAR